MGWVFWVAIHRDARRYARRCPPPWCNRCPRRNHRDWGLRAWGLLMFMGGLRAWGLLVFMAVRTSSPLYASEAPEAKKSSLRGFAILEDCRGCKMRRRVFFLETVAKKTTVVLRASSKDK